MMNRFSRLSRARGARAVAESNLVEQLEPRAMLAADLGVVWDNATINIPRTLGVGERLPTLAPILVFNNGPQSANGLVTIQYYLSTNTTLDANDILVRSFDREPISLGRTLNPDPADPNGPGTFDADLTIPPTAPAGIYYFIVRISPNSQVGDSNQSNNVAATDLTYTITNSFGNVGGRNIAVTLLDPEGTRTVFSLTGGGSGQATRTPNGFIVTTTDTGNNSALSITTSGGDNAIDLASVTINGSLGSLTATTARLIGTFAASSGMGTIRLGDVLGPTTITVPRTSVQPNFEFGRVTDLSIDSEVAITSIRASSWLNTDSSSDRIRAPWLGSMTINGDTNVNLFLRGRGSALPTLGNVVVTGGITGGIWTVNGVANNINALGTANAFTLNVIRRLNSITTTNNLRGTIAARFIETINAGRDIAGARILAGAWLGEDGVIGGAGSDTDAFRSGTINVITVGRAITNSIIGAGLNPTDGVFNNGNDAIVGGTQSRITRISTGGFVGAGVRILSNAFTQVSFGGNAINPATDPRFVLSTTGPSTTLLSTTVNTDPIFSFAVIRVRFTSTSLMALSRVPADSITLQGPGILGPAVFTSNVILSSALDTDTFGQSATFEFRVTLRQAQGPLDSGNYNIITALNKAADARGNFAQSASIGQFTIA